MQTRYVCDGPNAIEDYEYDDGNAARCLGKA
jgi:hypothetical protein